MPSANTTPSGFTPPGRDQRDHPSVLAFQGQWQDPSSHTYPLGNGYRHYHPALMQFMAPDSLSPFGQGGINAYAFGNGDPINHTDPSGHFSIYGWGGALGTVFNVIGLVGMAVSVVAPVLWPAAFAVEVEASAMAAFDTAVDVLGTASGITSMVKDTSDKALSAVMASASLALGAYGMFRGLQMAYKTLGGEFRAVDRLAPPEAPPAYDDIATSSASLHRFDRPRSYNDIVMRDQTAEGDISLTMHEAPPPRYSWLSLRSRSSLRLHSGESPARSAFPQAPESISHAQPSRLARPASPADHPLHEALDTLQARLLHRSSPSLDASLVTDAAL